jgi:hypothetical protein
MKVFVNIHDDDGKTNETNQRNMAISTSIRGGAGNVDVNIKGFEACLLFS